MASFHYMVTVEAGTQEQADTVMEYRCGHDEEIDPADGGPFDYSIDYVEAGEHYLTRPESHADLYMDPGFKAYAAHVSEDLVPKIADSAVTVSLVPQEADVKFAVELGFSVMLDKPIIAAVPPGTPVPERLRRVADEVIECDMGTLDGRQAFSTALKRVLDKLADNG